MFTQTKENLKSRIKSFTKIKLPIVPVLMTGTILVLGTIVATRYGTTTVKNIYIGVGK